MVGKKNRSFSVLGNGQLILKRSNTNNHTNQPTNQPEATYMLVCPHVKRGDGLQDTCATNTSIHVSPKIQPLLVNDDELEADTCETPTAHHRQTQQYIATRTVHLPRQ